jgi:phosphohistidine phosphatase
MNLYLVQHAESMPKDQNPERPLSDKGRADMERMAGWFSSSNAFRPSRILHSGKLRAQQTAEALAGGIDVVAEAVEGLAPLDDPAIWADRLTGMSESLVLVGHLPHLSKLASRLLSGDEEAGVVAFQMGGIVCLQRGEEGDWSLAWMVTPDLIP